MQRLREKMLLLKGTCRNEKPETLGIATFLRGSCGDRKPSRNEKPETLGIATQKVLTLSPEGLGVEKKSPK